MRKTIKLLLVAAAVMAFSSCNPQTWKKINYLQDVAQDTTIAAAANKGLVIQPFDQISIIVSSRNSALASQFNKTYGMQMNNGGEFGVSRGSSNQYVTAYVVDAKGNIDFPQIGPVRAEGLTRWELEEYITSYLVNEGLLTDATVTVEFLNFRFSVLGDVSHPGSFNFTGDKLTILQAIAFAGDLAITGNRSNVMVIREQGGKTNVYTLDLRSSSLFDSPAYYLQQNDVVYVTPNSMRAGQSKINENNFKSAGFWMSLASLGMTLINFTIALSK